jgi:hypothetical protein
LKRSGDLLLDHQFERDADRIAARNEPALVDPAFGIHQGDIELAAQPAGFVRPHRAVQHEQLGRVGPDPFTAFKDGIDDAPEAAAHARRREAVPPADRLDALRDILVRANAGRHRPRSLAGDGVVEPNRVKEREVGFWIEFGTQGDIRKRPGSGLWR